MFLVCSWAIFSGTPQPLVAVGYNIVAAITIFYAARWMAAQYWAEIETNTRMWVSSEGLVVRKPTFNYYFFRWPVLGMFMLVFCYIIISLFVDGFLFEQGLTNYRPLNFHQYTYARWSAESLYIIGGNIMAAIEYHFRQEQQRMKALEDGYQYEREVNQVYAADFKKLMIHYQQQIDKLRKNPPRRPFNEEKFNEEDFNDGLDEDMWEDDEDPSAN
jgi:hypothetical protein